MAVWTEYIGIFDSSCGTFGTPSYNPGLIDISAKTEGLHYIILKIISDDESETPEVNIKKMPKRMNFPAGFGKTELNITLKGYVTRRESGSEKGSAISKFNKIREFVNRHDEMSDDEIYLVIRERNADDNEWDYAEFEDATSPTHNYDVKFLKGKCGGLVKKYATYGYIEFTLQFLEAWL